jgi:hypothetical protein
MSSSSSDGRHPFLPVDLGSLVRLALVVAIGVAALVGPFIASTSARFSDTRQIDMTISVSPSPSPTPTP